MAYIQFLLKDEKKARDFIREVNSYILIDLDAVVDFINDKGYSCEVYDGGQFAPKDIENQIPIFEINDAFFGNHKIRKELEESGIEIRVLNYD
ncbi:MAG: hypothetical protein KJ767_00300 [Nanoarchaeota archaeon]|nr:hypothetical protein [Nanoarchaeota archaeon]